MTISIWLPLTHEASSVVTMDASTELVSTHTTAPSKQPLPIVALAGIPNAGKTSLFNALSGLHYKVANYPGVTVEKRTTVCTLPSVGQITLVDLPGTYSLYGSSPDEILAAQYLLGQMTQERIPDLIVCVVDACNLDRNLYLVSQLIDFGYPVIVALTMTDVASRRGITVRPELLSRALQVPVVDISGQRKRVLGPLQAALQHFIADPSTIAPKRYGWCTCTQLIDHAKKLGSFQRQSASAPATDNDYDIAVGIGLLSGGVQGTTADIDTRTIELREQLAQAGIDASCFEVENRYKWIAQIVKRSVAFERPDHKTRTDKIDRIVTHKLWGSIIFILIMGMMFHSIFAWAGIPMDLIDSGFSYLQELIRKIVPAGNLQSLLADGIVAGVGSVIIFVPQIAILYLFISLLEESGYLSRAACLLDSVMRQIGLQGRSFIPLLSSFACAIPGVMSTRSIPSFGDRMVTMLIAPLMSCSARLPVFTLLIAAFIPNALVFGFLSLQGLVFLSLYLLGIIGATLVAYLLKSFYFRSEPDPFVMEVPPYRMPQLRSVVYQVWDKVFVFVKNAGTVIMACSILLWVLATYPTQENASPADAIASSYIGQIGQLIEPIVEPLGYDWKIGVGIVASFAAREVFVSSMALLHNLEDANEESESLLTAIRTARDPETNQLLYSLPTALSLMVFFVFACQCMSTLAVVRRETGSWNWPAFMFVYMTVLAYSAALLTYQLGIRWIT